MTRWPGVSLALLAALVPADGFADGVGAQNHALSVHFSSPEQTGCNVLPDAALTSCESINPGGVVTPVAQWAWIILTGVPDGTGPGNAGGIGAIAFGLDHTLEEPIWSLCAGATEEPDALWPASGTGIRITWDDECHIVEDNPIGGTVIGILTIDAAAKGLIQTTGHPDLGRATTTDCAATTLTLCENLLGSGDAAAGGTGGTPACGTTCTTPVEETSWARLKSTFTR